MRNFPDIRLFGSATTAIVLAKGSTNRKFELLNYVRFLPIIGHQDSPFLFMVSNRSMIQFYPSVKLIVVEIFCEFGCKNIGSPVEEAEGDYTHFTILRSCSELEFDITRLIK